MHYYQFNIADYRKDTAHLSPIEHYIYRQLIDWYYLDEAPIPKKTQSVMRRLSLDTEHEPKLKNVLEDFFEETKDGWAHARIEAEIEKYHANAKKNAANGKKGGRPKKQGLAEEEKPKKTQPVSSGNPSESEKKPNQEPITNNQEPIKTHTPSSDGLAPVNPDPEPKPKTTEHHKALAKELSSAVAERFPSQKIKLTAWADDIRKLIEIDKRTDSEIRELWAWIQQHGDARFSWAQNIRTPGKLRERDNQGLKYFDKLADQMRQDSKQRDSGKPSSLHSFDNVDYSYGVTADGRF